MPAAVLWDMDEVLADTTDLHFQSWQSAMAEYGISLNRDQFLPFFGRSLVITMGGIFTADVHDNIRAEIRQRKETLFNQWVPRQIHPTPGVMQWLANFSTHCLQAVASSAPLENIHQLLDILNLKDYLKAIVSGSPNHSKPDPAVFLIAAETLKVKSECCLMIKDSPSGVKAALRAEMLVIAICTSNPAEKLAYADLVLPDLAALTAPIFEQFCKTHYVPESKM